MSPQSPCPRCRTVVAYAVGGAPTCPTCAYPGVDARAVAPSAWTGQASGWGAPTAPAFVQPARTSGKAVTSMTLGIAGIVLYPLSLLLGPIALVLGVLARKEIRASNGSLGGNGMAIAGIVLGIIGVVIVGFLVLAAVVFVLVSDLGEGASVVASAGRLRLNG